MQLKKKSRDHWPRIARYGKEQSPVALTRRFAYQVGLPPVRLQNFHIFDKIKVENTGRTVIITLPHICHCKLPKISEGGLLGSYALNNIHFHWPSEHVWDGIRYELEAHFVFYADKYETFEKALDQPYGITVMAIPFLRTNFTRSRNFRTIADSVKLVSKKPGFSTMSANKVNLQQFLPYDHETFYCYRGSLTTPPCVEFVNWIVFKNSSNISYLDLKDLTHIYDDDKELIVSNNRELQNVNDRVISIRKIM